MYFVLTVYLLYETSAAIALILFRLIFYQLLVQTLSKAVWAKDICNSNQNYCKLHTDWYPQIYLGQYNIWIGDILNLYLKLSN